jgi:hypothetical protein
LPHARKAVGPGVRDASRMFEGDLEAIRRSFRPDTIRVLLLGESPPPGRGFFYAGDSSLYRFTAPVLRRICRFPLEPEAFLVRFAGSGFFLDDFSSRRGDKPAQRADDDDVREAVKRIAASITTDEPEFVVGVLLGLSSLVEEAVNASGHPDTPWRCLPFPHPKNEEGQRRYQEGLGAVLRQVGCGPRDGVPADGVPADDENGGSRSSSRA